MPSLPKSYPDGDRPLWGANTSNMQSTQHRTARGAPREGGGTRTRGPGPRPRCKAQTGLSGAPPQFLAGRGEESVLPVRVGRAYPTRCANQPACKKPPRRKEALLSRRIPPHIIGGRPPLLIANSLTLPDIYARVDYARVGLLSVVAGNKGRYTLRYPYPWDLVMGSKKGIPKIGPHEKKFGDPRTLR